MSKSKASRIELSDMVVGLRQELLEAQAIGEKEDLKFRVDEVEIEVQVTVTKEVEGGAKCSFWIFAEAGGSGKASRADVQTIRLKLTPEQDSKPVKVSKSKKSASKKTSKKKTKKAPKGAKKKIRII